MASAEIELENVNCVHCGAVFSMSQAFANARREDHVIFYCPSGHKLCWPEKASEKSQDLKAKIAELEEKIQNLSMDKAKLMHQVEQMEAALRDARPNKTSDESLG